MKKKLTYLLIALLALCLVGITGCKKSNDTDVNVNVNVNNCVDGNCCNTSDCDTGCTDCNTDIGVCSGPDCQEPDYGQIGWQVYLPETGSQSFDIKVLSKGRGDWVNFEYPRELEAFSDPVAYGTENDVPVGTYDFTVKWRPTGWSGWAQISREVEVTHNNVTHVAVNIGDVILVGLAESSPAGFRSAAADDEVLIIKSWGPEGSHLTRLVYELELAQIDLEGTTIGLHQFGELVAFGSLDSEGRINCESLLLDPNEGNLSLKLNSCPFPLEAAVDEIFNAALIEADGENSYREAVEVYGVPCHGNIIIY